MFVGGLATMLAVTVSGQPSAEAPTTRYTVQPGDTCARISQRAFGSPRRYDIIHSFNPGMGPPPHDLVPGTVLILPTHLPTAGEVPDARLTAAHRQVLSRRADAAEWQRAARGQALFRGWRVNTLEASSAQVTFQDTSTIEVRANTLVVIYGGAASAARAATGNASLERGTLRSRLGSLRMRVDTPSSVAELDGGSTVISADDAGSRVSSHAGRPVRVRSASARGAAVRVRPGYGSVVQAGAAPSAPRPLPAAPVLATDTPSRFIALGGAGATVTGSWTAVPAAVKYHVELFRDATPPEVVAATDIDAAVTRFELRGLPPGRYHLTLASIDADGLESAPGEPSETEVLGVALMVPGEATPRALVGSEDAVEAPEGSIELAPGAYAIVPEGMTCDGADAERHVKFDRVGDQPLRCATEGSASLAPVPVEVVARPVEVSVARGTPSRLARGEEVTIPLTLGAGAVLPPGATWSTPPGVEVVAFDTEAPSVTVRASDEAPTQVDLDLNVQSVDGSDFSLATVPLTLADGAPVPTTEPTLVVPPLPPRPRSDIASQLAGPLVMGPRATQTTDAVVGVGVAASDFRDENVSGAGRAYVGLALSERVTVEVAAGGNAPRSRTTRDYAALGFEVGVRGLVLRRERFDLQVGADVWAPVYPVRSLIFGPALRPSVDAVWVASDRFALRGRAGSILDFHADALRLLTLSAMGDVSLGSSVSLGVEVGTRAGRLEREAFFSVSAGAYVAVSTGILTLTAYGHFEPSQDAHRFMPMWTAGAGARLNLGAGR